MPIFAMTEDTKKYGLQTYRAALSLPVDVREPEMAYLDLRDAYTNMVARQAQFEEAIHQAKQEGRADDVAELGKKLHSIASSLADMRERVRRAGEKSWTEAFYYVAQTVLTSETRKQIEMETDRLSGAVGMN